jgi:hypothetical protein
LFSKATAFQQCRRRIIPLYSKLAAQPQITGVAASSNSPL